MPQDRLDKFLKRLHEENGEDNERSSGESTEKKAVSVSSQQAGVDSTTWRKVPNSAKSLYYWYRQNLPSDEREQHGFYEFLDDLIGYLMSFSVMSNMNKAGKLIADYDIGATNSSEEGESEEE